MNNKSKCNQVIVNCIKIGIVIRTPKHPDRLRIMVFFRGILSCFKNTNVVNGCCMAPAVVIIGNATTGEIFIKKSTPCTITNKPTPTEVKAPQTTIAKKPTINFQELNSVSSPPTGNKRNSCDTKSRIIKAKQQIIDKRIACLLK